MEKDLASWAEDSGKAHEFAYEAWGLCHSRAAAPIGLLPGIGLSDPIEIPRWIRRRAVVI